MIVKRDFYLQMLIDRMHNGAIKVITGLRRSGKSTLLFNIFYDYLLSIGTNPNNIIKIDNTKRWGVVWGKIITFLEKIKRMIII